MGSKCLAPGAGKSAQRKIGFLSDSVFYQMDFLVVRAREQAAKPKRAGIIPGPEFFLIHFLQ